MLKLLPKPVRALALLAMATGGPYLYFERDSFDTFQHFASQFNSTSPHGADAQSPLAESAPQAHPSFWSSWFGKGSSSESGGVSSEMAPPGWFVSNRHVGPTTPVQGNTEQLWQYGSGVPSLAELQASANPTNLVGGPIHDIREVLRFDITPAWVTQRFARVTTMLAERNFDGLRAPVVTGTQPYDLAGTLTYYFDAEQRLRRLNLHALTGDPGPLVSVLLQYYHLKPEPSLGGHLYTTRWNNYVTSLMHIAPAPVLYASDTHSKFVVFLELNQPSMPYGLSAEAEQLYRAGKEAARW